MAYCVRCGAYIPDGQAVCLACGYDPEAARLAIQEKEKNNTSNSGFGSAAARQYSTKSKNDELRRQLEEQRKRSQEQNRQWAEQEKYRRDEQASREEARRRQQAEDRRWAQEEYRRRQSEQRTRSSYASGSRVRGDDGTAGTGEGNKALAALSYLSVLFALPYIFTPNDQYAKFHAKQGLKLFVFGILADMLAALIGFGWVVTLLRLYLIYKGMSNALSGKMEPLPWIGTIGESNS